MSQIVVFKCGDEEFGLQIAAVREVRRLTEIIPVPHSPDFIEGVVHLRGQPVAIIDLAKRLGIPKKERSEKNRFIVAKSHDTIVGLMVDLVSEVLEVPEQSIAVVPALALPVADGYIKNISDLKGRMILILDVDKILSHEEAQHICQIKEQMKK